MKWNVRMICFAGIFCMYGVSCTNRTSSGVASGDSVLQQTPKDSPQNHPSGAASPMDSSTHLTPSELVIAAKGDSLWVENQIDTPTISKTISVQVKSPGLLTGTLQAADSAVNLRFNQVIGPDKKSDGPFGSTFTYAAHQAGVYQIRVGASLMAENPYKGKFEVMLRLH